MRGGSARLRSRAHALPWFPAAAFARRRAASGPTQALLTLAGFGLAALATLIVGFVRPGFGFSASATVLLVGGTLTGLLVWIFRELMAPPALWAAVWTVGISIGQLKIWMWSAYQNDPWSPALWFVVLAGAAAFITSSALTLLWTGVVRARARGIVLARLDTAIRIAFVVAFGVYLATVAYAGGPRAIPIFSDHPEVAKVAFYVPHTSYFILLFPLVIIWSAIRVALEGRSRDARVDVLLSAMAAFCLISSATRSLLLEALVIGGLAFAQVRRISVRFVTVLGTALVAIFLVIGAVRQIGDPHAQNIFSINTVGIENRSLAQFYLYFGTEYRNLQHALRTVDEFRWGGIMLRVPLNAVGLDEYAEAPDIFETWNTSTALTNYFFDFGYAGIVLIPSLLGVVTAIAYWRGQAGDVISIGIYAILGNCIIASIATDRFFEGTTLWYLVLTTVVTASAALSRRADASVSGVVSMQGQDTST